VEKWYIEENEKEETTGYPTRPAAAAKEGWKGRRVDGKVETFIMHCWRLSAKINFCQKNKIFTFSGTICYNKIMIFNWIKFEYGDLQGEKEA
jgi:hypothetical protein